MAPYFLPFFGTLSTRYLAIFRAWGVGLTKIFLRGVDLTIFRRKLTQKPWFQGKISYISFLRSCKVAMFTNKTIPFLMYRIDMISKMFSEFSKEAESSEHI